ncbi:hypothetical protein ACU686_41820 [Yinghuangia aomiensis]
MRTGSHRADRFGGRHGREHAWEVFRCPACGHLELFANQPM